MDDHGLKHKLKSTLCLSCCFRNRDDFTSDHKPTLGRSSSTWFRSRAQELPEIKDKCRNLISRIGRGRRHSADFKYDALSYALNFDEGYDDAHMDEYPLRNFSSRLPSLTPKAAVVEAAVEVATSREIAACS